jgi:predicted kinase
VAEEPVLVAVCGPPGVGKSLVARTAADAVGGAVLRTDIVRQDLFDDPGYTDREVECVYAEMCDRARERLAAGTSVVLDGTHRSVALREAVAGVGEALERPAVFLRVTCPASAVRDRIAARTDDPSEAEFEDYRAIAAEFEPIERGHHVIDNAGTVERTRQQVCTALEGF